MKIAICQLHISWMDKNESIKRAELFVQEASQKGAELILFPEMSFTGFSMEVDKTRDSNYETVECMKQVSEKYNIAIGFGWVKTEQGMGENHYTVVDKHMICTDYIKIHPFSYSDEDKHFRGGDKLSFFSLKGRKISPFICYDLRFPELFQGASKESDIIFVAANWPEARREHWRCLLRARAIENQSYVLGINCVGRIGDLNYSGDSCMIAPDGKVIGEVSYQEGLLIEEIPDDVNTYRSKFPMKKDRKPEFYKEIL